MQSNKEKRYLAELQPLSFLIYSQMLTRLLSHRRTMTIRFGGEMDPRDLSCLPSSFHGEKFSLETLSDLSKVTELDGS